MIPACDYQSILINLSNQTPLDLDPLIFDAPQVGPKSNPAPLAFPPSSAIWHMAEGAPSRIGVRIREPIENAGFLAARLASMAVEREIHPVFLSYIGKSDMQQFGFRVEQVFGLTVEAQTQFELQLARLWRFALIVDASEVERLS